MLITLICDQTHIFFRDKQTYLFSINIDQVESKVAEGIVGGVVVGTIFGGIIGDHQTTIEAA